RAGLPRRHRLLLRPRQRRAALSRRGPRRARRPARRLGRRRPPRHRHRNRHRAPGDTVTSPAPAARSRLRLIVVTVAVTLLAVLLLGDVVSSAARGVWHAVFGDDAAEGGADGSYYTCGMHPWVVLPHPGDCPICHMKLE